MECPSCEKSFRTQGDLNRHEKTHSRPFACEKCDMRFGLKTDLTRHHTSKHGGFKIKFYCSFDGCLFKGSLRQSDLRRHIRNTHGNSHHTVNGPPALDKVQEIYTQSLITHKQLKSASFLHTVVEKGNIAMLQKLISMNMDISQKDHQEMTLLHVAAMNGSEEIVQMLLKSGIDAHAKDDQGNIALHHAARSGYDAIVNLLSNDKHAVLIKNRTGHIPLHVAVLAEKPAVVQVLLQRHQIANERTSGLKTALHLAASTGNHIIVKLLLENNADMTITTRRGWLPFDYAIINRNIKVARLLLTDYPRYSPKPILKAAENEYNDIILCLLNCGFMFDSYQYSNALDISLEKGHGETAQLLLDNIVDVGYYRGYILLFSSAIANCPMNERLALTILEKGLENDRAEFNLSTAVKWAVIGNQELVVRTLLEYGADIGSSIVLSAACSSKIIFQMALDQGGNIHERFGIYDNAMCAALANGQEEIVQLLLELGENGTLSDAELSDDLLEIALQSAEAKASSFLLPWLWNIRQQHDSSHSGLREAVKSGDKMALRNTINNGKHSNSVYGMALAFAAMDGDIFMIEFLLYGVRDHGDKEAVFIAVSLAKLHGRTNIVWRLWRLWSSYMNRRV